MPKTHPWCTDPLANYPRHFPPTPAEEGQLQVRIQACRYCTVPDEHKPCFTRDGKGKP